MSFYTSPYLDAILIPLGTALFVLYHLYLVWKVVHHPTETVIGYNNITRDSWVKCMMLERKDICAVQTLRNSVMGSSILATAAVAISAGLGTVLASASQTSFVDANSPLIQSKLLILTATFLLAFLCYLQSIRYTNHVAFLINIPITYTPLISSRYVASHLKKGMNAFTIGTRFFYLAFLYVFWFFGPVFMVAASLLMVATLFFLDSATSISTGVSQPAQEV